MKTSRVYVSLRQELYDDIPALYEDAQKYRDLLATISWTEDSLLKLIAKRIRHCAQEMAIIIRPLTRPVIALAGTRSLAPRLATRRTIPSDTWSAGRCPAPKGDHPILHRNVEHARERGVGLPLPCAAIGWTERAYSAERAKDIAAEYRYQYPGLLGVFDAFRGQAEILSRDDIQLLCLELATGETPTRGTSSWLPDREPGDPIEILWHIGFLTAQPASGNKVRLGDRAPSWACIRSSA